MVRDGDVRSMQARWITTAFVAVLVASCSSAYDTTDFLSRGPKPPAPSETAAAAEPAAIAEGDASAATETAATPASVTASADAAATQAPPAGGVAPTGAAAPPAEASATDTASPIRGFLAMFRSAPAPAAAEAAAAVEAAAPTDAPAAAATKVAALPPVEDVPPEEFSEADLAGEVEADPEKIAVPEEPIDDGLEHDFVNVYSSRPDAPAETVPGLPGVTWEGNLVVASRGDDGDAGSLFNDEDHPFARTVPGIPRQVVQAANGLLLAHSAINVSCVKPNLLGLVRRAESHFGKKVVVTSGYRSPSHNKRVRGARFSQHLYCNALDLYMPGVTRDDLARYFFSQPDRGGIGLYCHTRSIHIDTGRKRQWRWSCRKRG